MDEILDTVTLYWLSNSATSSARFYWETEVVVTAWKIDMPVGVSMFLGDTVYTPREWVERYHKNIVYCNEVDKGGHFAAWENAEGFVRAVRGWARIVT
jgi:pimeloyl-ACP methyl ester carboxylesterase